jgi:NitT/TauT family transport system substrate-binding protein
MNRTWYNTVAIFMMIFTATLMPIGLKFHGAVEAKEKVAYRLKWLFNASVVGDIYADAHNIFGDEGLDVTVKEGGPERDAIRELEMGRAQFGVASADQVIRAMNNSSGYIERQNSRLTAWRT